MGLNLGNIFKYLGLAMEAANQAAIAKAEIAQYKDPDSDGGREITEEEMLQLAVDLQDNFSEVVTRILQEFDLPIESVEVKIKLTE